MIAFPMLLIGPAMEAGMSVPDDPDSEDKDTYPHWFVFLEMQLGRPMPSPNSHWENAKVVAGIPDENIRLVTPEDLDRLGYQ